MEKTSYEILKNIQAELSDLSNNLEHQYYKMHEECIKELIKDKQDIVTQKNEMYALYEKIINSETLGRCFGKKYGKDVSVDNEPCKCYEFGGSKERLKKLRII